MQPTDRRLTPSIEWCGDHLRVIDQTRLPGRLALAELRTLDDVVDAIARLVVRGAPLIGVCAAYGLALGVAERAGAAPPSGGERSVGAVVEEVAARLVVARPTAVNLAWAVRRAAAAGTGARTLRAAAGRILVAAGEIADEDRASCLRIGEAGRRELAGARRLLTHCNTGRLATAGWGTALGVVYAKAAAGEPVEVMATESRPLLQGSRLTAWELVEAGIPVTLVVDGAAATALAAGSVDAVVVGCDRVAANGDTANKIGTRALALAAHAAGVPFYVAGPLTSFDPATASGAGIEVELRDATEVLQTGGVLTAPGEGVTVWNPAFDVTPAELITAFVTDAGVLHPPYGEQIPAALAAAPRTGAS